MEKGDLPERNRRLSPTNRAKGCDRHAQPKEIKSTVEDRKSKNPTTKKKVRSIGRMQINSVQPSNLLCAQTPVATSHGRGGSVISRTDKELRHKSGRPVLDPAVFLSILLLYMILEAVISRILFAHRPPTRLRNQYPFARL